MNLIASSATAVSLQLAAGRVSATELVEASLKQIAAHNPTISALLSIDEAGALAAAKEIDRERAAGQIRSPLAGIPILLKDNILVRGWKASAGSRMLESYTATYDATIVERLRRAGVILLGRANMDEMAMGSSTETSHYGPTKNPWDTTCVPGGSSGGSAAGVAAGFAPLALGSDTGGSVRQPASLCGLVGFKPTYGRVSRSGVIALASSLDQIGTFTRTVSDAALLMQTIEGEDPRDATSCTLDSMDVWKSTEETSLEGLRIGLPKEFFGDGMDASVRRAMEEAIALYEALGATCVEVSLPNALYALETYYIILPAEASSNLARYDGMRYGHHASGETLLETYERSRGEGFGKEVKRRIMLGTFSLSAGAHEAYYGKALAVRDAMREDFRRVFEQVDVLFGPTSPTAAWKFGGKTDPLSMYLSDIYTIPANLAGNPAMSVPCGYTEEGLPIGFQIMARPFEESMLYRVGHAYQQKTDWHERVAPIIPQT